jgi:hypothetical protein
MKTIEYRVQYTGNPGNDPATYEIVRVRARTINSGFFKALGLANRPLGNGTRREIGGIEFWQVV